MAVKLHDCWICKGSLVDQIRHGPYLSWLADLSSTESRLLAAAEQFIEELSGRASQPLALICTIHTSALDKISALACVIGYVLQAHGGANLYIPLFPYLAPNTPTIHANADQMSW